MTAPPKDAEEFAEILTEHLIVRCGVRTVLNRDEIVALVRQRDAARDAALIERCASTCQELADGFGTELKKHRSPGTESALTAGCMGGADACAKALRSLLSTLAPSEELNSSILSNSSSKEGSNG